jgi:hypothetical protein
MKYLKRFNESDSWAGSIYAYGDTPKTISDMNPFTQERKPTDLVLPKRKTYPYKCLECEVESYCFKDEVICASCGSENLEELPNFN